MISGLANHVRSLALARGRKIVTHGTDCILRTDGRLLRHVLFNLLVNALEASPEGAQVDIGWSSTPGGVRIDVDNEGLIPEDVEAQFFKRYVSTKGEDRGLGLYTAKVFAENHLAGRLEYAPVPGVTRFSVFLPKSGPAAN